MGIKNSGIAVIIVFATFLVLWQFDYSIAESPHHRHNRQDNYANNSGDTLFDLDIWLQFTQGNGMPHTSDLYDVEIYPGDFGNQGEPILKLIGCRTDGNGYIKLNGTYRGQYIGNIGGINVKQTNGNMVWTYRPFKWTPTGERSFKGAGNFEFGR